MPIWVKVLPLSLSLPMNSTVSQLQKDLGFLAIFAASNMKYGVNPQPGAKQVEVDEQVRALNEQSSSDEVGDIEKDITETNVYIIDYDLGEINSDIGSL